VFFLSLILSIKRSIQGEMNLHQAHSPQPPSSAVFYGTISAYQQYLQTRMSQLQQPRIKGKDTEEPSRGEEEEEGSEMDDVEGMVQSMKRLRIDKNMLPGLSLEIVLVNQKTNTYYAIGCGIEYHESPERFTTCSPLLILHSPGPSPNIPAISEYIKLDALMPEQLRPLVSFKSIADGCNVYANHLTEVHGRARVKLRHPKGIQFNLSTQRCIVLVPFGGNTNLRYTFKDLALHRCQLMPCLKSG
jgi:hypothetical protein